MKLLIQNHLNFLIIFLVPLNVMKIFFIIFHINESGKRIGVTKIFLLATGTQQVFIKYSCTAKESSSKTLHCLAEQVLTLNCFLFCGYYYKQTNGIAMGTKMGPRYINLFINLSNTNFSVITIALKFLRLRCLCSDNSDFSEKFFPFYSFVTKNYKTFLSHPTVSFSHLPMLPSLL